MLFTKKPAAPLPATNRTLETPQRVPPSVLSSELKVVGTLLSTGAVVIDGHVEGDIHGRKITVGETGCVEGTVQASEVVIGGRVRGEIRATTALLRARSAIEGTIDYHTLCVDPGASFNGTCRQSGNPAAGSTDHDAKKMPGRRHCDARG